MHGDHTAAVLTGEEARLEALAQLQVLDSSPEERFDRVTRLCTRLFGVPMAAVSLVARDRQWVKSAAGLEPGAEVPREHSFCSVAIEQEAGLVVSDLSEDQRFMGNPMVVDNPHLRFYAGRPLEAPGGHRVGTLCLFDHQPRQFSDADEALLADLALWVQKELAIDEELERAAEVQRGLLPKEPPLASDWDVAGGCLQSRQVGGDLLDWYDTPHGLVLTVADVMGKGMPAAIMAATIRAVLRGVTRHAGLVAAVAAAAECMESDFGETGAFTTLVHASAGVEGRLRVVDAGHGLGFVVSAAGQVTQPFVRGLPAGAAPLSTWQEDVVVLAPGEALVVLSDGVLDLHSSRDELRAAVCVALTGTSSAAEAVEQIVAPARGVSTPDDVTALVVRRAT